MTKHIPPEFGAASFTCPHCRTTSRQRWFQLTRNGGYPVNQAAIADCDHCQESTLWRDQKLIFPDSSSAPEPHEDMPDVIKPDYLEAASILNKSPRGAAALLRLALQKLLPILGANKPDINAAIGELVAKGLPVQIQQACDTLRVIGNESVHPGSIDLRDTPEVANHLFAVINLIVEVMISQPKKIAAVYSGLPTGKLDGIKKRDGT